MAQRLRAFGHEDFTAYVVWVCERALERGLLPHTNLGVLSRGDLARLREVTASQGLMLESVNPELVAHQGSPSKHPARGSRRSVPPASCASPSPAASWWASGSGRRADRRAQALAEVHAEHGHLQEVILQNASHIAATRGGAGRHRGGGAPTTTGARG